MDIKTLKVGEIHTNCYIVSEKSGEALLVDPGGNALDIKNALFKIKNLNLKYILLTHAHYDHVLALDEIKKEYPKADVIIGEKDVEFLRSVPVQGIYERKVLPQIKSEIIAVTEGEYLTFGDGNIKVLETPGHTPGGVCYLIDRKLFSGDTLFYHTIGRTDLPGASENDMKESLEKILMLDPKVNVYPGHGESTTIKEEKKFWGSGYNEKVEI